MNVLVKKASPSALKTTSTGLSMPPVITDSMAEPSGRARKMWDALS